MKTLLTLFTFFTAFLIRGLRWLYIVQKEEYKLVNLLLFIKSKQGRKELFRLFPHKTDFSKTGFKRPQMTFKTIMVAMLFFLQLLFLVYLIIYIFMMSTISLGEVNLYEDITIFVFSFIKLIIGLLITLFLIPILVFIATIPIMIIAKSRE